MKMEKMQETKRFLSFEEFNNWISLMIFWSTLSIATTLILLVQFSDNAIFVEWFVEHFILYFFFFLVGIIISVWVALLFEFIFQSIWVDYFHDFDYKEYYEKDIKKSLSNRKKFLITSSIIFVLSFLANVIFIQPYQEVKNIQNTCWINYQQAYKIKELPKSERELVVKHCKIKKEKQWIDTIINNFLENNKLCAFNQERIDEIKNLYEKKDEESIKIIKNIISNEVSICKENIIKNKVESMDNKFDWDFGDDFNNLIDFQKRINEI